MRFEYLAFGILFLAFAGLVAANDVYNVSVTLVSPPNNNYNASPYPINFTFRVVWQVGGAAGVPVCTLYTNATGNTWAIRSSNTTTLVNDTTGSKLSYIDNYSIPANGTILWNIECNTTNNTYSNFQTLGSNRTLFFDNSTPVIKVLSPANNSYANKTTANGTGDGVGNMTFKINVTGLNVSIGSQVNCTVSLNSTDNHTNSTLTTNGVTRWEYLQIPENQTSIFNITCATRVGSGVLNVNVSNATNDTMYYYGIYFNPTVTLYTPVTDNWTNSQYLHFNFSTNHSTYYNSYTLNCSILFNNTWNATNATVNKNQTNTTFFVQGLAGGAAHEGTRLWNVTCMDAAGNKGYATARSINIDRSLNNTWLYTNITDSGGDTLHSVYWTDARNLSGFVFASNYSGSWANDSWVPLYAAAASEVLANYSNVTKYVNATSIATTYAYYFCANDSLTNWGCIATTYVSVGARQAGGGGSGGLPTATPAPTPTTVPPGSTPTPTTMEIPTPTVTATPTGEPIEMPTGMVEEDAQAAIADAEAALASPVEGADVARAQQELNLALQFMDEGDYNSAVGHAREAVRLANTVMPAATVTPSYVAPVAASGGSDWLLYAVVILVLAGAGYYFFGRPKKGL